MNADTLVTRAKTRAFVPTTSAFSTQSILDEINTALRTLWVPALLKADGEFFTEIVDVVPDSAGNVKLPDDSVSNTARVLTWVDANGQESAPLRRIEQGDVGSVANNAGLTSVRVEQPDGSIVVVAITGSGGYGTAPVSFTLTPDGVQVLNFTAGGRLRCRYSRRPGELVAGTSTTVLQVVTVGVSSITTVAPDGVVPVAGTWAGKPLDVTSGKSPHRRQAINSGGYLVNTGPNAWNYASPPTLYPGDYLTFPGTSYIPNAPVEWHDLLMYYASAQVASLRKDYELETRRLAEAAGIFKELLAAAQPRTKQNPKTLSAWAGRVVNPRGLT